MSTFDQREESFENKFVHDAELRFKAEARRNKLLAAWAVEKLGKPASESDAFFKDLMNVDIGKAGDGDVLEKLEETFSHAGVAISTHQIRRTMDEFFAKAVADIKAGR